MLASRQIVSRTARRCREGMNHPQKFQVSKCDQGYDGTLRSIIFLENRVELAVSIVSTIAATEHIMTIQSSSAHSPR